MPSAAGTGIPFWVSPLNMASGRCALNPAIISEKNRPMERTIAAFWKVVIMPAPDPREVTGSEFITSARFGDAKSPMPIPLISRMTANTQ